MQMVLGRLLQLLLLGACKASAAALLPRWQRQQLLWRPAAASLRSAEQETLPLQLLTMKLLLYLQHLPARRLLMLQDLLLGLSRLLLQGKAAAAVLLLLLLAGLCRGCACSPRSTKAATATRAASWLQHTRWV